MFTGQVSAPSSQMESQSLRSPKSSLHSFFNLYLMLRFGLLCIVINPMRGIYSCIYSLKMYSQLGSPNLYALIHQQLHCSLIFPNMV